MSAWMTKLQTEQFREDFLAQESCWEERLDWELSILDEWLSDPINIHDALAAVEDTLRSKHHDYGEDNLKDFGELGILVRSSDKVARLKNLIAKQAEVMDESRYETWRDLAGYAIQAMIMLKRSTDTNNSENVNIFEIRKNRLIRGYCPDCGAGVLLRSNFWENCLHCSQDCGFSTGDLYAINLNFPDFNEMIEFLARQSPYREQK